MHTLGHFLMHSCPIYLMVLQPLCESLGYVLMCQESSFTLHHFFKRPSQAEEAAMKLSWGTAGWSKTWTSLPWQCLKILATIRVHWSCLHPTCFLAWSATNKSRQKREQKSKTFRNSMATIFNCDLGSNYLNWGQSQFIFSAKKWAGRLVLSLLSFRAFGVLFEFPVFRDGMKIKSLAARYKIHKNCLAS